MSDMKKDDVNAVLSRVLTWPAEAQQEAVASLRAIEDEWVGGAALVRYPYKIFYRILDDGVRILHIRHTSRPAWEQM
jgi:plasmid stabilization system protein ParE